MPECKFNAASRGCQFAETNKLSPRVLQANIKRYFTHLIPYDAKKGANLTLAQSSDPLKIITILMFYVNTRKRNQLKGDE